MREGKKKTHIRDGETVEAAEGVCEEYSVLLHPVLADLRHVRTQIHKDTHIRIHM